MHTPAALAGKSLGSRAGHFRNWDSGVPGGKGSLSCPLVPLGRFRVKAGRDLAALRLRPQCGELAFRAPRSRSTATLRSPKEFGIQGTLRNLTGNLSAPRIPARTDPFPLQGHLGASAFRGVSWAQARTSGAGAKGCCLGSTSDSLSAARKQREPGAGRLRGVPARPEA